MIRLALSDRFHLLLKVRKAPQGLKPALDPSDPFADEDKERQEVEALARKFESKYVCFLLLTSVKTFNLNHETLNNAGCFIGCMLRSVYNHLRETLLRRSDETECRISSISVTAMMKPIRLSTTLRP